MSMAEQLLAPLAGERPCGEDLSYDPAFMALDSDIKGKPETQFSAAEEPNWKEMRARCLELMERTRDLRLAVYWTLSGVRLDGLAGLNDGLRLVSGLVAQHWDTVYPLLDPDDKDPTERLNILGILGTPLATYGDPYKFVERVRDLPLCRSRQLGRAFSVADFAKARAGEFELSAGQLEGILQEDPEANQSTAASLREALELLVALEQAVNKATEGSSMELTPLRSSLQEMLGALGASPNAGEATAAAASAPAESSADRAAGPAPTGGVPGRIETRQDVVRALEQICRYYETKEPSSPIPLLLKRAQLLVDKSFLEIIRDLAPDAIGQIENVAGKSSAPAAEGQ